MQIKPKRRLCRHLFIYLPYLLIPEVLHAMMLINPQHIRNTSAEI